MQPLSRWMLESMAADSSFFVSDSQGMQTAANFRLGSDLGKA